ncbi:sigma-54 dependent transcriptional regulator [Bordetella parapertussis]|uniref:Sigma-54 dependent transcriptional regulator n=2 Tax=Bordetella parapertussis TaxID=519 RepID=A0ABU5XAN2_BORPP|nr:sigma-54 dependent transcriptional regulator [Bordetella parapertussis]MEB2661264.1 sigma-54 dependent transcriptional regulator [Bordetella parapertussis]MEB2665394.1 sigma-54 dependent transcriptional regulator [Bordetella parapertussis]MEB2669901.1 sigma-54 dependent transcriptional regulator [Bordetella parapertussis]
MPNQTATTPATTSDPLERLAALGPSACMRKLAASIERAADSDATVLLVGESGTGKDVLARAIHDLGGRRDAPFMAINCGAISPTLAHAQLFGHEKGSFTGALSHNAGYFENASGGTLFLDEITEMPPDMQVHFLRVLETGAYRRVGGVELLHANVRIIGATNRDPHAAVAEGRLREDLLHRLLVLPLRVPPLRERPENVRFLAQRFLDELNARHGTAKRFSGAMLDALAAHDWPGNARELRNAVQRAYILQDGPIGPQALADTVLRRPARQDADTLAFPVGTPLECVQRELILATLARAGGDKRRAARTLAISLKTLYNRLNAYGVGAGADPEKNRFIAHCRGRRHGF